MRKCVCVCDKRYFVEEKKFDEIINYSFLNVYHHHHHQNLCVDSRYFAIIEKSFHQIYQQNCKKKSNDVSKN